MLVSQADAIAELRVILDELQEENRALNNNQNGYWVQKANRIEQGIIEMYLFLHHEENCNCLLL